MLSDQNQGSSFQQTAMFYSVIAVVMLAIGLFSIVPTLRKVDRQDDTRSELEEKVAGLESINADLKARYDAAGKSYRIAQLLIERYGYRFKD
ncbi:MAG: hypothetical protein NUW37_00790 [Planctomycetes bacterium]|nr:hypothetical protein [Planctomycetota bacterium]